MTCLENNTRHENLPEIDQRPKVKAKTAKLLKDNKYELRVMVYMFMMNIGLSFFSCIWDKKKG